MLDFFLKICYNQKNPSDAEHSDTSTPNRRVTGSTPVCACTVAQLVEQHYSDADILRRIVLKKSSA